MPQSPTNRMNNVEKGKDKASRQCWECLKRRLVCDRKLPHCKKCQKAGRECPGYDDQKPLQWIQPGKVTSRRRKKEIAPKIYTVPKVELKQNLRRSIAPSTVVNESEVDPELFETELAFRGWQPTKIPVHPPCEASKRRELFELPRTLVAEGQSDDRLFPFIGDINDTTCPRSSTKDWIEGTEDPLQPGKEILQGLQNCIRTVHPEILLGSRYLAHETSEIVQAAHYYNVRMHPEIVVTTDLAPNPSLILFPLHVLHVLPPAVHHTLVCLALNHFIQGLPTDGGCQAVITTTSKIFHHRGAAIRSLSEHIGKESTRCSDVTLASVLMFMSMELQNPIFVNWWSHANGMRNLIDLRGGILHLIDEAPHLIATLMVYIILIILANSFSSSREQIHISGTSENLVDEVAKIHHLIFPWTLCPPELFLELIRVNQLRRKVWKSLEACELCAEEAFEAHDTLTRLQSFVPEDWAQPGPHYEEWLLIGTMYQAAITVYCLMSLQSITVLPNTLEMNTVREIYADCLVDCIKAANKHPRVRRCSVWPLVVAGVEAVYRGEGSRNYIDMALTTMSRELASGSPLKARALLRRFWEKGDADWDRCFDRPYVFGV